MTKGLLFLLKFLGGLIAVIFIMICISILAQNPYSSVEKYESSYLEKHPDIEIRLYKLFKELDEGEYPNGIYMLTYSNNINECYCSSFPIDNGSCSFNCAEVRRHLTYLESSQVKFNGSEVEFSIDFAYLWRKRGYLVVPKVNGKFQIDQYKFRYEKEF
jgi:hypothetical protein